MVANSREFLMIWDSTMANPNGDMLNDNQPRCDENTGQLEVSDARIKRFIRDELDAIGEKVFVKTTSDKEGKVLSCAVRAKEILKEGNIKETKSLDALNYISKNFIDVRLFGITLTKPKAELTGSLQVMWSKSINIPEVKLMQGNSAYASKEGKDQATIWSKYIAEYALFSTYAVFNSEAAKRQGIEVTDEDIEKFKNAWIQGMIHYRSTSKNQMPRILIEIEYNNNYMDGELNYLNFTFDENVRNFDGVNVNMSKLENYIKTNPNVKSVNIYTHRNVNVEIPKTFNVIPF